VGDRREIARLAEEVAHARRADADEHLDELGARGRDEGHARLARDRAREQRLARAGRPLLSGEQGAGASRWFVGGRAAPIEPHQPGPTGQQQRGTRGPGFPPEAPAMTAPRGIFAPSFEYLAGFLRNCAPTRGEGGAGGGA
jgi:hypothetical protein